MTRTRLVISGPPGTQEVLLEPKGVILGRSLACDVTLDHFNVSRVHARIFQDACGRWIVEDMDSRNGVLVGGRRVEAQAVQYGQTVTIHPFDLSVMGETARDTNGGQPTQSAIPIVDKGTDEQISLYRGNETVVFSPALVRHLNELSDRLLKLSGPCQLYTEASRCLAGMLNTVVAIVRLPLDSGPLPESPDVLALHVGNAEKDPDIQAECHIRFSKRVLDAVRRTSSPVMASSVHSRGDNLRLTVADEHCPHLVFSAQVNKLIDSIDVLYIDISEGHTPDHMFDFVEASARQINFSQKSLFLAELEKQEEALREANALLKQKDRIKDEYVSRVTHDIKGHLAAIQNCLYAISETSGGSLGEKPTDFLSRAMNRTRQLTTFVRELLSLTKMRLSGRLEVEPFSLPQVLRSSLAAVENMAQDKSIRITSEIEAPVGDMVGNEFSITEMVTNLLFNAIKYTPAGGTVHLQAGAREEQILVDIRDTGIGIPTEELERVFDEFFRASNACKSKQGGSGLGLSIVKQIVKRHGGTITVQSDEGRGSTFMVRLPRGAA